MDALSIIMQYELLLYLYSSVIVLHHFFRKWRKTLELFELGFAIIPNRWLSDTAKINVYENSSIEEVMLEWMSL